MVDQPTNTALAMTELFARFRILLLQWGHLGIVIGYILLSNQQRTLSIKSNSTEAWEAEAEDEMLVSLSQHNSPFFTELGPILGV